MNRTVLIASLASTSLLAMSLLSGCAPATFNQSSISDGPTLNTTALDGSIMGGRQAISGAHIYMSAANTSAYGAATVSLIENYTGGSFPSTVDANGSYYITTNASGGFSLAAGEYACTPGQQVFVYSYAGDSGAGNNTAATLIAVLGTCQSDGASFVPYPGASTIKHININEVSTVAAAYALSGYMQNLTHASNDATDSNHTTAGTTAVTNEQMANAFNTAANMYNVSTISYGYALPTTPNGNGVVPQAQIFTLANILAQCVNTASGSSSACSTLFAAAPNSSGTLPANTANAMLNIVHNPAQNVSTIFNLMSSSVQPYAPVLTSAPNDWTLGITYTGGGMTNPNDIAIDASGNAWTTSNSTGIVSELSPLGVPASSTGYSVPGANFLAMDGPGNAWVTSSTGNDLYELASTGAEVTGSPFLASGTRPSTPGGVTIDKYGNVFVASPGNNDVFAVTSSGTPVSGSPFTQAGCTTAVVNIMADNSSQVLAGSPADSIICKGNTGAETYTNTSVSKPERMASDSNSYAWIASNTGNTVAKLTVAGGAASGSPYSGGGLNAPMGVAIDGLGNAWVANSGNSSVSEFSSTGTALSVATTGFTGGRQNGSANLAVDGAGNVWVTNHGANTVTELVGAGAPVVTPLATGVANQTLGTRP